MVTPNLHRNVVVLEVALTIALGLAVIVAYWEPFAWRAVVEGGLAWVGGWLLRQHCRRQLGDAAFVPQLRYPSTIVRTGLYRWLAHPSYIGAVLECYGVGCLFGTVDAGLVLGGTAIVVYAYRADVEDVLIAEVDR